MINLERVCGFSDNLSLFSVTGCNDSLPRRTTNRCYHDSATQLSVHGVHFSSLLVTSESANKILSDTCVVFVGEHKCTSLIYASDFKLVCTLPGIGGEGLDVTLRDGIIIKAALAGAVSYRPVINYRKMFDLFVSYGVGGMKEQIEELYRRAFASRGMYMYVISFNTKYKKFDMLLHLYF